MSYEENPLDRLKSLIEKDRELDRLKAEIKALNGQLTIPALHMQSLMDVEKQQIKELKKLIADLLPYLDPKDGTEHFKQLIQRAWEVTRTDC
jgi:hypothetical protein